MVRFRFVLGSPPSPPVSRTTSVLMNRYDAALTGANAAREQRVLSSQASSRFRANSTAHVGVFRARSFPFFAAEGRGVRLQHDLKRASPRAGCVFRSPRTARKKEENSQYHPRFELESWNKFSSDHEAPKPAAREDISAFRENIRHANPPLPAAGTDPRSEAFLVWL